MRLLVILLVILTAIVSLGFWTNNSLNTSTDELLQSIEKVAQELENNNWDSAYQRTLELENTWEEKAKWWPMVLDHQEIDNIEFAMAKVKEYIATQNIALSWGQLSEIELMIKHIPEKEAITIKNIL